MPHPYSPPSEGTKGFQRTEMWTNVDELLDFLGRLSVNAAAGVWVSSTDMLLTTSNGHSSESGGVMVTETCVPPCICPQNPPCLLSVLNLT